MPSSRPQSLAAQRLLRQGEIQVSSLRQVVRLGSCRQSLAVQTPHWCLNFTTKRSSWPSTELTRPAHMPAGSTEAQWAYPSQPGYAAAAAAGTQVSAQPCSPVSSQPSARAAGSGRAVAGGSLGAGGLPRIQIIPQSRQPESSLGSSLAQSTAATLGSPAAGGSAR